MRGVTRIVESGAIVDKSTDKGSDGLTRRYRVVDINRPRKSLVIRGGGERRKPDSKFSRFHLIDAFRISLRHLKIRFHNTSVDRHESRRTKREGLVRRS